MKKICISLSIILSICCSVTYIYADSCTQYEQIRTLCKACKIDKQCAPETTVDCPNLSIYRDQCNLYKERLMHSQDNEPAEKSYNSSNSVLPDSKLKSQSPSSGYKAIDNNLPQTYSKDIRKSQGIASGIPGKPTYPEGSKQKAPNATSVIMDTWY